MHFVIRGIALWLAGILSITAPLAIHSTLTNFPLWECLGVLDIFAISTVATMMALMFPAAYFGANNGAWGDNPEAAIFIYTSFITLPLMMVFPNNEHNLHNVFMDRDIPTYAFMALWWSHGAINAAHVKIIRRHQDS